MPISYTWAVLDEENGIWADARGTIAVTERTSLIMPDESQESGAGSKDTVDEIA